MITVRSLGGPSVACVFGKTSVMVFPKDGEKADVTLLQHPEEDPKSGMISWPGEYDFGGVTIYGIGHEEGRQVSYVVTEEGVRFAFLSSPLHPLSDAEQEQAGDIDVLVIPADDAKAVQTIVDALDPRVLIPLPTKDDKTFAEVLKICGAAGKEAVDEWKLKGSLPQEGREVVVLKEGK